MADMDFTKTFQFTSEGDNTIYTYSCTNSNDEFVITWNNGKDSTEYPLESAKRFFKKGIWVVKHSLRSLYEVEKAKLDVQQKATGHAWSLVIAEEVAEDSARKASLHAKQVEVDTLRDHLNKVSDSYHLAAIELDEMLRNEPF